MRTTVPNITKLREQVETAISEYCEIVAPAAKGSEYLRQLQANTDRIQGMLVVVGYDALGGQDTKMILRAALAIEMLHAYVQCLDNDTDVDQALRAAHEALIILANLDTDEVDRLKVVSITNRTLMLTAQSRVPNTKPEDAIYWRATEQALNPMHVGQVLTGSDCDANNAVTPLMIELGTALHEQKSVDLQEFVDKTYALF